MNIIPYDLEQREGIASLVIPSLCVASHIGNMP